MTSSRRTDSGRLRAGAHVERADDDVGDPQGNAHDTLAPGQQRALLGGRAGGDREGRTPGIADGEARLECPGGGPHDLGQARPRLDGLGDRVEGGEIGIEPGGAHGGRSYPSSRR